MRAGLAMFVLFVLSLFSPVCLRAEDAADPQAQIKQLTEELNRTKAMLKAVQSQKNEAQSRLDMYKKAYDKLLEAVQSEQTLLAIKEAGTKVDADFTERLDKLNSLLERQAKKDQ